MQKIRNSLPMWEPSVKNLADLNQHTKKKTDKKTGFLRPYGSDEV